MSKKFDRDALLKLPHKDIKARYEALFGEPPRSPNKVWMVNQMQEEHERRKAAKKAEKAAAGTRARAEPTEAAEAAAETEAPQGETESTEPPPPVEEVAVVPRAADTRSPRRRARGEATEAAAPVSPANEFEAPDNGTKEVEQEALTVDPAVDVPIAASGAAPAAPRERGRYKGMTVEELRVRYSEAVGRPTSSTDKHYLVWKILQAEKGRIRVGPVEPGQRREGDLANADKTLPLTLTAPAVEAMDAAWRRMGFPSRMNFMRAAIREQLTRGGEAAAAALFGDKGAA